MSANGSPLAVFGGARATFGIDDGAEAQPVIQVALQDGNQIDLTDVEATNELSTDAREEARGKLQGLQVRCILLSCSAVVVLTKQMSLQDQLQQLLAAMN